MCNLVGERKRIDAILAWAACQDAVRDSTDQARLADFALAVLREYYDEACPDECIRKRCEDFAATVARQRAKSACPRNDEQSRPFRPLPA